MRVEASPVGADCKADIALVGSPSSENFVRTDDGILTRDEAQSLLDPVAEKLLLQKLDIRVLLPISVIFFWAFIDRLNIGYAKLQGLEKDLGMVGNDFNVALLVQIAPYIFFEIPSNLILKHVRLVKTYPGLIVLRVFLGLFEAGLVPGAVYLTSMYYTRFELQKRMVGLYIANCIAIATGGLLAYGIGNLQGNGGLDSWRWIYIIEGSVTISLSILLLFIITNWPSQAKWLSSRERKLLVARQIVEDGGLARMDRLDRKALRRILTDWKIYSAIIIYFAVSASSNATAFVPTIIARLGYTNAAAQAYTIPIYVAASGAGMAGSSAVRSPAQPLRLLLPDKISDRAQYGALFLFNGGCFMALPTLWTWLSNNMAGHYKRSWASAAQIGLGNAGAIVPTMTFVANEAPTYRRAYTVCLTLIVVAGLVMILTELGLWWENRLRVEGERDYRLRLPPDEVDNLGDDHQLSLYVLD
ncbi:hypothetical protein VTN77DRAFT_3454 [Rasamsonia byssochlamydoides]|uniref:uncharacterized protein n=1 Tax=Rasamsonia byssochlamydoides TaxID=89139 RepID=UPI0037430BA4